MQIITTNLKEINLSSKFLKLESDTGEMLIDIKQLLSEPVGSENAYFNATEVCKMFNKRVDNFLRLSETCLYIEKMEQFINTSDVRDLYEPKKAYLKMVKTIRGRYNGGTYFHKELFLKFASWLSIDFEIAMHQIIKSLILQSNSLKIERDNVKIHFKELSDVIKDKWIPAQDNDNAKKFAYSNIATLVNLKVFGTTSSKYAKDNGIEIEKGKSIRDYVSLELQHKIDNAEKEVWAFIFTGTTEYEILKNKVLAKEK